MLAITMANDDGEEGEHGRLKRIAECNGTQCGFCTPGHVMAMYSLLREGKGPLSIPQIEERFDGTICRCTGYRPIIAAAKQRAAASYDDDEELERLEAAAEREKREAEGGKPLEDEDVMEEKEERSRLIPCLNIKEI